MFEIDTVNNLISFLFSDGAILAVSSLLFALMSESYYDAYTVQI